MNKCLLILLCILTMQGNDILMAQQDTILVFAGSLDTSPTALPTMKPCLSRTERLSSDFGGVIEVIFGTGISEEMQYCIKAAAKLWEEKLYIPKKVILKFEKVCAFCYQTYFYISESGCYNSDSRDKIL